MTEPSPVVAQVLELSRQVLVQSKHLADLINVEGTTEDAIIDSAKLTAGITAQLYNTLSEAVQHGSSDQTLKTSLLASAKEVRGAILDLIQSTKDALLNPFDFQATQKVQNCCVTVATNVKEVITQVQALDTQVKGGQSDAAKAVEAEKVKACANALRVLVDTASTSGGQQQEFLDSAKKFATTLGAVIEVATSKNNSQVVESLKESAQALLTAAKSVFKSPQDKVAKESLDLTCIKLLNTMKELAPSSVPTPPKPVLTTSGSASGSNSSLSGSPASSFPGMLPLPTTLPPPAVEVHLTTPLPPPTLNVTPVSAVQSAPGALPSPPPLNSFKPLPTPPGRTDLPPPTLGALPPPDVGIFSSKLSTPGLAPTPAPAAMIKSHSTVSLPGSPAPALAPAAVPASPMPSSLAAIVSSPLLPPPALTPTSSPLPPNRRAGLKASGIIVGPSDYASTLVDYLKDNFASFKADWEALPLERRNTHLRLMGEKLAEQAGPAAHDELDNIANMRDFNQFKNMGTIRGGRPPAMHTMTGRNLKDLLATVSSEYDPSQPVIAQFRVSSEQLTDVVTAFIMLAHQFSRGEGSSTELVDLMRKLLQLLKKILAITNKQASNGYPEVFIKLIGGALKVVDDAKVEAVVDQHVVAAATGQAVPYVDSMLRKKLYNDANALRVVSIYLLATLYAYQENIAAQHILLQIAAAVKMIVECAVKVNNTCATYRYIIESADKRKDTSDVVNLMQENDVPIYEEKKDPAQSEYDWEIELRDKNPPTQGLGSGSFNKLVAALTSDKALDSAYMKAFIATYRSFATPWQLLEKLVQRYNVPKTMPLERGLPIKLRVSVVIKYWVESHFDDFEEDLVKKLFDFCDNTLLPDKQTALAKQLREFLTNKVEQRKAKYQRVLDVPPTDLVIPAGSRSPSELFMALNDEEISRQLSLIDFQMFQHSELLNQAWNKDKLKYRAPNVIALLTRLNHLSYWIPCLVLWQEKQADRASMLAKLFRVADLLRKSNNFHTLMALVAGLNNASLQRLRSTKKLVGDQLLLGWSKIEKLMHPQGSFKDYRAALHKAKPPALPYLGMYLTDLTFIDDGNPDMVDNKINWNKRELTYRVLSEIELYQQVPYSFPPVEPIRTFLTELPGINEKELFELSLLREPRETPK